MAQEEQYGTRDGSYSAWHRRNSTKRFVGIEKAQNLAMIDLDVSLYVEYDDTEKHPLCLIETAVDVGQKWKPGTVTRELARRAGLRAYVLLYTLGDEPNPADDRWPDITGFRARRLWPEPVTTWRHFTPAEWAEALVNIRSHMARRLDAEDAA